LIQYESPGLLTLPREEEEVYPYQSVWFGVIVQVILLSGFGITMYALTSVVGASIPAAAERFARPAIALLPAGLWVILSLFRERFAPEPRTNLAVVFILSVLVTNGVSRPFLDSLDIERWLDSADTFNRIIGYMTTVGIVQETLKYLIIRFSIWPEHLRIRADSAAYSFAAAIGAASVLNLSAANIAGIEPDHLTYRMLTLTMAHIAGGVLVSYGIASVRFNRSALLVMPFTLVTGALIHAVGIAVRPSVMSGGFVLGIAGTRTLFGLLLPIIIVVATLIVVIFLFNNAERQDREAAMERE